MADSDHDLKILIVDDEPNIRAGLAKGLQGEAQVIETAKDAAQALERFSQHKHDIVITDLRLPGQLDGLELLSQIHDKRPETMVVVVTAYGTVETAVEAMRCGAYDFVTKPVDLGLVRHQVRKAAERRRLVAENQRLRERLAEVGDTPEIVGTCAATQDVLRQVRQVAQTDATVLVLGESGTGKELTARAIHQLSSRWASPFVIVNLGALPETLLESELFGHEKGAFTGADRRKAGRFEGAAQGTVFLDEITETSARSQVDLLRVLEQREFHRLGGSDLVPMEARVISATNKDIESLVGEGKFREDLYYRLNVVPLRLPPLRERRDDIPLLVEHFLRAMCERHAREPKRMTGEAMQILVDHAWPGNIRQLRNLVERLVVTVESDVVHADDLPADFRQLRPKSSGTMAEAVETAERQAISAALAQCDHHRERAAKVLDISVRSLHYKMNRHGLH
jgi:two-component system NtrC family response regulator